MYSIKKDQPFYSSLRTLRFFIVYRAYSREPRQIFLSFMSVILSCMAFTMFIIVCILHAVISIEEHFGGDISEDLSISLGGLGMLINNILFTFHREKWSSFFKDVTNVDTFGKPTNFNKVKNRGNFLSSLYIIYCTIGTIVYSCVGVLESSCEDFSNEVKRKSICGTLSPIWLPVEEVSITTRNCILLIQYILANYIITPSAVICFLPFETTELLICHISYLKENILEIFQCEDEELSKNRLRFCIIYHTHILRMANQLKYMVKFSVGHMSLICAMVFGCIGNQIFKAKPVGAAIFLFGYMVSLFLLCYAGQRIIDESLSIAEVVYQSKWYEANTQMRKSIQFTLARCQIPLTLNAWPFGIFCFPLFMMIVKTSYSYLTLLRQTT